MDVRLLQDLKQFNSPDTSTPSVGKLVVGTYEVVGHEVRGSDEYVRVATWICSKSGSNTYAVLGAPPVEEGIDEQALVTTLQRFRGYVYSLNYPKYTGPIPNVTVPLEPPKQDSCCTFVEDLVVHGFQLAGFSFEWNQVRHDQMMVADWNDLWSPPHGVADAGLARAVQGPSTSLLLPQPWTVCQGWGKTSGHTFIVLATHQETGKVLVLESNSAYGFSGPGLRGLGDLDGYLSSGPPADWWKKPSVPTWADLLGNYSTGIAAAQLKVRTSTLVWGKSS